VLKCGEQYQSSFAGKKRTPNSSRREIGLARVIIDGVRVCSHPLSLDRQLPFIFADEIASILLAVDCLRPKSGGVQLKDAIVHRVFMFES
jgi:hypothetical protein